MIDVLLDKFILSGNNIAVQGRIVSIFQDLLSYASSVSSASKETPDIINKLDSERVAKTFYSVIFWSVCIIHTYRLKFVLFFHLCCSFYRIVIEPFLVLLNC